MGLLEHRKLVFNSEKHKLGSLCGRGHEYMLTGKSVRYKNGRGCAECKKLYIVENKDQRKQTEIKYYEKTKGQRRAYSKKYYEKNKIKIKKYRLDNPGIIKKSKKKYSGKIIDNVNDIYIRELLVNKGLFDRLCEIPQEIIEAKREQILMHRLLKEAKHGITGTRN